MHANVFNCIGGNMSSVCIVEDEKDLSDILDVYIRREGWECLKASCLAEAHEINPSDVNIWVIDLMLPDGNGFELLKEIKSEKPDTPCIVISARGDSIDRVLGFEMGCDDYIAKPFMPQELIFRLHHMFDTLKTKLPIRKNAIDIKGYTIDLDMHEVRDAAGQQIELTTKEYDLISYFVSHPNQILSRDQIMQEAWNEDFLETPRSVDNFVKRIRSKIPVIKIETVYGSGYRCVI